MTQTVAATAQLGPGKTGLAIGYRVLDIDRVQYSAFTTTNVAETGTAGTYSVSGGVVAPNAGGYIVWGVSGTDYAEATVDSDVINSVLGTVSANLIQMNGDTDPVDNLVLSIGSGGFLRANLVQILGTTLTETSGLIAAAFKKFFNVNTPTGTLNSLPDAVAGASGGLAIVGSEMGLANDAITAGKFDELTAFPLKSMDTGNTKIARVGGDSDTLETLSDQLDAIQNITGNIDVTNVTYVAESNAGHLTITIGRTFDESVTALVIPVDWEEAYFTIKRDVEDDEAEAIVQLLISNPTDLSVDGLRRLNAVLWHEAVADDPLTDADETSPEPFDQDLGSLTVNQAGGSIRIYLTDELTAQLSTAKRIGWDVKFIDSNGDSTGKRGIIDLVRTETQTV